MNTPTITINKAATLKIKRITVGRLNYYYIYLLRPRAKPLVLKREFGNYSLATQIVRRIREVGQITKARWSKIDR